MPLKLPEKIKLITVDVFDEDAGTLEKNSQFRFSYLENVKQSLSLTMNSVNKQVYNYGSIHPVFAQNLPEGFVRRYISEKLQRVATVDDMYLLALQGNKGLGHLGFSSKMPEIEPEKISLDEIIKWNGKGSIFTDLLEKYYLNGIASGVQPKVLVPSQKTSAIQSDYIVKSFDSEYPDLAVNEYVCMSAAKNCGIEVPKFWITDDRSCFVVERFDRAVDGGRIAMEDFTVLLGSEKYKGSYENLLKAAYMIHQRSEMVESLYRYIVFSCLVGNGDAHLKNFAILYERGFNNIRIAPMYDVVNTLIYDSVDNDLALKMNKSKVFPDREKLIELAAPFPFINASDIIDNLGEGIMASLNQSQYRGGYPELFKSISDQVSMTVTKLN